jgi:hypothetical protein|tara:strand:+ start:267 stop:461 length:195 start_codon:yes stop_codon:yes gene_type:complete
MKGVPHYKKDGSLYCGSSHKDESGRPMTGRMHTDKSEYLFHYEDLEPNVKKNVNKEKICKRSNN